MKSKIIYLLAIVVGGFMYSCKDFLDEVPKNATHGGEYWKSATDVQSALAGNYALLRNAITSGNFNGVPRHFLYGDGVQGNNFTIQYDGDGLEGVQTGDFTWRYNVESYGNWTPYIKCITMSNLILEKVEGMNEDLFAQISNPTRFKNEALGQAYYIRALTYFFMTRIWGDVPLILETEDDPITADQAARVSKEVIMKQIIDDCHKAAALLNWNYTDVNAAKVTANKGAVYALLAHAFLWKATTTNLSSNDPIIEDVLHADTTIQALKNYGGYSLVDTANYYNTFIGKSREGIFEIAASEDNLEGSTNHIASFFLRQQHIPFRAASWSRFFVPKTYLDAHYEKMPTGIIQETVIPGQWVWNEPDWRWDWVPEHTVVQEAISDKITDIRYIKNFADISLEQPTCIKYHKVNLRTPDVAHISNNIIIFRYADMLLLEAEIAIYKNELSVAAQKLNTFRSTRDPLAKNKTISGTDTRENIMFQYALERSREMYLEGHIYYDLIRTRQYPQFITWLSPDRFRQGGFYWPVSPLLFKNNPNLAQTPYWIGKI